MTLVVLCFAYAGLVTLLAPLLLTRGRWQVWHPRLALGCWHAALLTSGGAVVLGLAFLFGLSAGHSAGGAAGPVVAATVAIAAWVSLAVFTSAVAYLLAHGERIVRRDVAERIAIDQGLDAAVVRYETWGDVTVRHLDSDVPAAYSFRAPSRTIVVTKGLTDLLSPAELEAVMQHERAHLDDRHHLAVLVAVIVSRTARGRLHGARLERATRLLTELIADDRAARICGLDTTASALAAMSASTGAAGAGDRAARLRSARPIGLFTPLARAISQ